MNSNNPTEPKGITPPKPYWCTPCGAMDQHPKNSCGDVTCSRCGNFFYHIWFTPKGIGGEAFDVHSDAALPYIAQLAKSLWLRVEDVTKHVRVDDDSLRCMYAQKCIQLMAAKNPTPEPLGEPTDKYPRDVAFQRILDGNALPMSRREWFDEGWIACQSLGKSEDGELPALDVTEEDKHRAYKYCGALFGANPAREALIDNVEGMYEDEIRAAHREKSESYFYQRQLRAALSRAGGESAEAAWKRGYKRAYLGYIADDSDIPPYVAPRVGGEGI